MSTFHPQLFGRYLLLERLASGGMAEVYRAKTFGPDGFEKQLAIKRILPHYANDRQFIEMLTNEAKLTVQLNHTNVVQVYDFGRIGADWFISMEFIFGVNLYEIFNRLKSLNQSFPPEIALYLISEVCRGLEYAHSKAGQDGRHLNIIHRDISPPNILVSFEGEVKIVDFGIAKAAENTMHTAAGVIKGKIAYMSPEQAKGEDLDHRSDIFSTGMMLYELLTGHRIFKGESHLEVLRKIQSTEITGEHLKESFPPALRQILLKSLAFDREGRYSDAGSMQTDLVRYLNATYPDFTSRQLKVLIQGLFAKEIKKGKEREEKEVLTRENEGLALSSESEEKLILPVAEAKRRPEARKAAPMKDTKIPPGKADYPPASAKVGKTAYLFIGIGGALLLGLLVWGASRLGEHEPAPTASPAAPAPSVAAPTETKILLDSTPKGAKVFLNNRETYLATPTLLENIPIGKPVNLTLRLPNYQDWTQTLTPMSAEPLHLNPALQEIPKGSLIISSQPPGAKIFLDQVDTGKVTPAVLDDLEFPKNYRIRLELDNYIPLEEAIALNDTDPFQIERELTKMNVPVRTAPKTLRKAPVAEGSTPSKSSTGSSSESKGGAAQTMGKGFKKAGSSIKGFFSGKKSEPSTTEEK